MRIFCSCVYSFVICCSPLCVPRPPFPFLGLTLGSFWVLLGSPWTTLGRLGLPWRSPWSVSGDVVGFGQNWTSNSKQMALKYDACAQKMACRNYSPAPPYSRPGPGPCLAPCAGPQGRGGTAAGLVEGTQRAQHWGPIPIN